MTDKEALNYFETQQTPDNEEQFKIAARALRYKMYFDSIFGEGLMVVNWSMNGDLEPLANLIESAEQDDL